MLQKLLSFKEKKKCVNDADLLFCKTEHWGLKQNLLFGLYQHDKMYCLVLWCSVLTGQRVGAKILSLLTQMTIEGWLVAWAVPEGLGLEWPFVCAPCTRRKWQCLLSVMQPKEPSWDGDVPGLRLWVPAVRLTLVQQLCFSLFSN